MIKTKHGTKIEQILGAICFNNTGEFSGLLHCIDEHGREVQIRLDALQASSKKDEKILEEYRRMIKKDNPKKEVNMPKKKDNPGTGEIRPQLPPDEDDETKVAIPTVEEEFLPAEEETEEEEQPSLFEGDKVYNELQCALTDVNEDLKKVDKQISDKQLTKSILINRKERLQEAIKIYEAQRTDKE